ncbi:MAG: HAD-IA family hydrolase [Nanoarchaeota archaeon]
MAIKHICFDIGRVANIQLDKKRLSDHIDKQWNGELSWDDLKKALHPYYEGRDIWREFQNGQISADTYLSAVLKTAKSKKFDTAGEHTNGMLASLGRISDPAFFNRGEITNSPPVNTLVEKADFKDSSENKEKLGSTLKAWCGIPYQPMLDLVGRLNQAGYYTSVLSNNNEIMYYNQSSEIRNIVHLGLSSHLIGLSKPDGRAYQKLLWVTGAKAEETIFVDDKQRNIEAAERLWIHGFRFRSEDLSMDEAFAELVYFLQMKGVKFPHNF